MGLRTRRALVVALIVATAVACGRRGDPRPPKRFAATQSPPRVLTHVRVGDHVAWRLGEAATTATWLAETVDLATFHCSVDAAGVTAPTTPWSSWPGAWLRAPAAATATYVRLVSTDGTRNDRWRYAPAATTLATPAVTAVAGADGRITLTTPAGTQFWLGEAVGGAWLLHPQATTMAVRGPYPPGSQARFFVVAVTAVERGWVAHPVTQTIFLDFP